MHPQHAADESGAHNIVIRSSDTDVMVFAVYFQREMPGFYYDSTPSKEREMEASRYQKYSAEPWIGLLSGTARLPLLFRQQLSLSCTSTQMCRCE